MSSDACHLEGKALLALSASMQQETVLSQIMKLEPATFPSLLTLPHDLPPQCSLDLR
jgi:hypothetical protein